MQQNFLSALAFALAHSLWQGLLIGLLVAVVLPKMRSSVARYRLAFGALLSFFAVALASFWHFMIEKKAAAETAAPIFQLKMSGEIERVFGPETTVVAPSFFEKSSAWLLQNQAFIVGLWLIGFAFFFLKLVGGWFLADRFKTRKTARLAEEWEEIFRELVSKMPIEKPVRLLESALVAAPVTLGWLRPVVLFPIGLVNRLSIDEVEAVMAHELAHIARRDWLANLAQSFVECLFYYHPVVWRLAARVREERENCADDLALAVTRGEPIGYAKTLVAVQEWAFLSEKGPKPALALAFSDKNSGSLAARIQRILIQQQPIKNLAMEKITATALLLGLAVALSLRANPAKPMIENLAALATDPIEFFEKTAAIGDSISPKSKLRGTGDLTFSNENESIKLKLENDQIKFLEINGEMIPAEKIADFEPKISEMIARIAQPPLPPDFPEIAERPELAELPEIPELAELAELPEIPELAEMPELSEAKYFRFVDDKMAFGTPGRGKIWMFGTTENLEANNLDDFMTITDGKKKFVIDGRTNQLFLNGKALKEGENLSVFSKKQGTNAFFALNGKSFRIRDGQLEWRSPANEAEFLAAEKEARNAQIEAEKEAHEMAREAREHEREALKQDREIRREMERADREARREAQLSDHEARRDAMRAERDAVKARSKADRNEARAAAISSEGEGYSYSSGDAKAAEKERKKAEKTASRFDQELEKDGFDVDNLMLRMTSRSLKIDGKTQPDAVFEKYKAIYEAEIGEKIGDSFNMTITRSSN